MARNSYNHSVFINCPIDSRYERFFRAIVFSVLRCGYNARCAAEEDDGSAVRMNKIFRIIGECRFGIHDLSRVELDRRTKLPRFNMPLELGMFLSAKYFGRGEQDQKVCLIFERTQHSYQAFISDIRGQEVIAHRNAPRRVVVAVRNWLAANSGKTQIDGGVEVWSNYNEFLTWLPRRCGELRLRVNELIYVDLVNLIYEWIEKKQ